jgi:hypothetical protein
MYHIWYIEVVYKLRVTFKVELQLNGGFYLLNIQKVINLYGMNEQSSRKDMDGFRYGMISCLIIYDIPLDSKM